ncbi:MAG: oxygen-insensitive NAD(P)H nitroreductase [Flavobacteriia bacterium]|nr:MAG: oxygen-insensitive NAD(P)H nitroreductase [Flavobacteriia bacterium]
MNISELVHWRYSTKEFDPGQKIPAEKVKQIKDLLRLSPSSTNIQPWHFILTDTQHGKERILKGMQGPYNFNELKVRHASHVVVFCAKTSVDDTYLKHLLDAEDKAGRYKDPDLKRRVFEVRNTFTDIHRHDFKDLKDWLEKQVYLNIGHFVLGVAAMGLDSLIMEGADFEAIDREFDLQAKGLTSIAVVAVGYRSANDFNIPANTPKARLPESDIFTVL